MLVGFRWRGDKSTAEAGPGSGRLELAVGVGQCHAELRRAVRHNA
jgi:hypothetical protein